MNPNNSEFVIEDEMNGSDFATVSAIGGMDMKQIIDKIQKLEDMAIKSAQGSNIGDQSGIMKMGWQMGEKFGKMELKMDGIGKEIVEMKDGMTKIMKELEGLKVENKKLKEEKEERSLEIEGIKKENADENAKILKAFEELKEEVGKLTEANDKLNDENGQLKDVMTNMKKVIEEMKLAKQNENQEIEDLKKENLKSKEDMTKLKEEMDGEFADEKNAELEGKIAGLKEEEVKLKEKMCKLERKIEEMSQLTEQIGGIEWVKYNSNEYKLNSAHCGPKLTISEGGLVAKHSGYIHEWNSLLANLPIPSFNLNGSKKPRIVFYFETQIVNLSNTMKGDGIVIGFCEQQFPLEGKYLGLEKNSIGICNKDGIWIGGKYFKNGNFIGLGIIHQLNSKMEYFATCNGKLLGKAEIPPNFANLQIYPAVSLFYVGDSIRVNFDKENCQFKDFGRVLQ